MEDLDNLAAKLERLSKQVDELATLSEGLSNRVLLTIERTSALIITLCSHREEVRYFYRLQTARHNLKIAVQKANQFLDQVHEVSFHCSAESELMKAARAGVASEWNFWIAKFYTPDFHPLSDLIDLLTQNVSKAETYYVEFEEACDVVISTCTEAAEICKRKIRETQSKKETTKMVGGAAVVASTLAGIFIPGVGAATTAVVAVGGAAVTAYLVHELEQSEKAFRGINRQFESLLCTSHSIKEEVSNVETALVHVSGLLDSVILHRNNHKSIVSVRHSLGRLNEIGSQVHKRVSRCSRSLESKISEL